MSNEWNTGEVLTPSQEEIDNMSPEFKKIFIDSLRTSLHEEAKLPKKCTCDCHYSEGVTHMFECCHLTYVQFKKENI